MLISMSKYISNTAKQNQYLQTAGNHLHCLKSSSALRNWSVLVFCVLFCFFFLHFETGSEGRGFDVPCAGGKLAAEVESQGQAKFSTSLQWPVSCALA